MFGARLLCVSKISIAPRESLGREEITPATPPESSAHPRAPPPSAMPRPVPRTRAAQSAAIDARNAVIAAADAGVALRSQSSDGRQLGDGPEISTIFPFACGSHARNNVPVESGRPFDA